MKNKLRKFRKCEERRSQLRTKSIRNIQKKLIRILVEATIFQDAYKKCCYQFSWWQSKLSFYWSEMVLWSIRDSTLHGKINAYTVALSTLIHIATAYDLLIKGYGWFPLKAKAFALTSVRNKPRTYEPANATYSFLNRQVKFWVRRLNEIWRSLCSPCKEARDGKTSQVAFFGGNYQSNTRSEHRFCRFSF